MERPRTGPMQFPGEIQPGVYLDHKTAREIFTGDGQRVLGEIRNALQGIQPVQQARLEEQVNAAVQAIYESLDDGLPAHAAMSVIRDKFRRTQ